MKRIATIILLAFITVCGAGYVVDQTGGPAWRPKTNPPPANPSPTYTPPYVPTAPTTPVPYNPNNPTYSPTTSQRSQVEAQLNQNRAQQQQLKRQLQQLKDQERVLRDQLRSIDDAQNGYYEDQDYAAKGHHVNGKHKGWYKNGKADRDNDDD